MTCKREYTPGPAIPNAEALESHYKASRGVYLDGKYRPVQIMWLWTPKFIAKATAEGRIHEAVKV